MPSDTRSSGNPFPAAVRADLHAHSDASDGTTSPAEVVRRAAAAGLEVVALTDHDTVAGHAEAVAALPPGLTLLPGMELSCRLDGRSVHMLAYLFDPGDPDLAAEITAIRESRLTRARQMVERLEELGTGVTWEQVRRIADGGVVGRPHIARAMVEAGVVDDPAAAFTPEWIAPGGRAHVARYAPAPTRAIALVRAAGGITVLAHPRGARRGWLIPDEAIAEMAGAGLTGLEIDHPHQDETQRARLRGLAADLDLVPSGGSDDHGALTGFRIGSPTAPPDTCWRLAERASGAARARLTRG